jgi:hypothetical protein
LITYNEKKDDTSVLCTVCLECICSCINARIEDILVLVDITIQNSDNGEIQATQGR